MLASIVLVAASQTPEEKIIGVGAGNYLRAFFYNTIHSVSPALFDALHQGDGLKPFTISPLLRQRMRPGGSRQASLAPIYYRIRFTVLTADLYQAMAEGLLKRCQTSPLLPLGPQNLEIQQVLFTQENVPWAGPTSYEALYQSPPQQQFFMRFLSPTSFRMGIGNLPFPLPVSIYRSLWEKWQRFAPSSLSIDKAILKTVERSFFPAHHILRTRFLRPEGAIPQVGFVGVCRFAILGEISKEKERCLTALSRFANYAGVGMKTTVGMGQVMVSTGGTRTPGEALRDGEDREGKRG